MKIQLKQIPGALVLSMFAGTLALGTPFTYQGNLTDGGQPADGTYDLQFILFGSGLGGTGIGSAVISQNVAVSGGTFSTSLDFGASAFDGSDRWLEIGVRSGLSNGGFETLRPRQKVNAAPIAQFALDGNRGPTGPAGNNGVKGDKGDPGSSGAVGSQGPQGLKGDKGDPGATGPQGIAGSQGIKGDTGATGAQGTPGVQGPKGDKGDSGSADAWSRTGNAGTSAASHFIGTTDAQPFEIRAGGIRALRLEAGGDSSDAGSDPDGAPNVIAGAANNSVSPGIAGGTIGGGGAPDYAGFQYPNIVSGHYSTVCGGLKNSAGGESTVVGGGHDNETTGDFSTVSGGIGNSANFYASVGGGDTNTASGSFSTVPGGSKNVASGSKSLAAGTRAKAAHDGAFVWADSTDADFASTATNQFLIRANGGVGINTNSLNARLNIKQSIDNFEDGISLERSENANRWTITHWHDDDLKFFHSTGTTVWMSVGNAGTLLTTSDRRFKKDIEPISDALEKVAQLKPSAFHFNHQDDPGTPKSLGFIAQEVEPLFPGLVAEKDDRKTLAYTGFIPINTRAIQELNVLVKSQAAEIEEKDTILERHTRELAELRELVQSLAAK